MHYIDFSQGLLNARRYSYMGPGTHVIKRVLSGIKPINHNDTLALAHDINYLIADGDPKLLQQADQIAINNVHGDGSVPMILGLQMRKILGIYNNEHKGTTAQGLELKRIALNNPEFNLKPEYFLD